MRRACILRQLGRCAENTQCRSRPALRRDLAVAGNGPDGLHPQSRPFNSSASCKEPWKLAPPQPPSVRPHPHSPRTATDDLSLSEQLRSVMRLVPHSVVVCTSSSSPSSSSSPNSADSAAAIPRGMTMSSFTSLTLYPTPIVTFNIATPSRTLDAVVQSRQLNIHVLGGGVEGAKVAEWFTRGNTEGLGAFDEAKMKEGCGCEVIKSGGNDAPLLRGPGVLYALRCELLDEPAGGLVRVRDHVVVLAEVVDITEGEDRGNTFGLSYADRRYRQLGCTMVSNDE